MYILSHFERPVAAKSQLIHNVLIELLQQSFVLLAKENLARRHHGLGDFFFRNHRFFSFGFGGLWGLLIFAPWSCHQFLILRHELHDW